jgi:hypothetical protein
MSESAVGVLVNTTRQNAGAAAIARATGGVMPFSGTVPGGTNTPAATVAADVTVPFAKRSDDKLSHEAPAALGL